MGTFSPGTFSPAFPWTESYQTFVKMLIYYTIRTIYSLLWFEHILLYKYYFYMNGLGSRQCHTCIWQCLCKPFPLDPGWLILHIINACGLELMGEGCSMTLYQFKFFLSRVKFIDSPISLFSSFWQKCLIPESKLAQT